MKGDRERERERERPFIGNAPSDVITVDNQKIKP